MAKNIVIDEAGIPKNITVDGLRLNGINGDSHLFKPDSGLVDLCNITIYKSGTYNPKKMHADGFAVVNVQAVKGSQKIYDITGEEAKSASSGKALVSIKEGGNAYLFSDVAKIRTREQGGGTCDFAFNLEMGEKSVTENGVYRAQDDGLFAYKLFVVDVADGYDGDEGTVEPSICGEIDEPIPYTTSILMTNRVYDDDTPDDYHYMTIWNNVDGTSTDRVFGIENGGTIKWYWVAKEPFVVNREQTETAGSVQRKYYDTLSGSGFTIDGDYVHVVNFTSVRIDQFSYYNAPVIETDVEPNQCDLHAVAYG